jgi:hypothetical protein
MGLGIESYLLDCFGFPPDVPYSQPNCFVHKATDLTHNRGGGFVPDMDPRKARRLLGSFCLELFLGLFFVFSMCGWTLWLMHCPKAFHSKETGHLSVYTQGLINFL